MVGVQWKRAWLLLSHYVALLDGCERQDCFVLYERANGQPRVSVVPIPATPAPGHEPPQFQRRPVELPEGTCQIEPGANLVPCACVCMCVVGAM